ncbi:MAG TPA: HAD-IA family hydrolase, partial [Bacilli bacterium]
VREIPYVREVLSALYEEGIQLGIVTTKIRRTTLRGLEFYGLDKFIKAIVTIEDVNYPKPHPEPVLRAMEALSASPRNTVMVGDTAFDIKAANSAGVTSIGVGWSLFSESELRQHQPDYIIQDMRELLQIVGLKGIVL